VSSFISSFQLPRLSLRFIPILRRNFLVWRKFAMSTVLADVADPFIALMAFGYGLGALIGEINGVPYITFLAAGMLCQSAMFAATFEATYSAFSRLQIQRTWDAMLMTPLSLDDVILAELVWAALKSLKSVFAILMAIFIFGISREPMILLAIPILFLLGLTMSALALVWCCLAKGYEFFMYYFTLFLTPMLFISGTYFPVDTLPKWLVVFADLLPMKNALDLVRPLLIGHWPAHWFPNVLVLMAYCLLAWVMAVNVARRRLLK
jgi:lipooligosaccharide transport system permease protein